VIILEINEKRTIEYLKTMLLPETPWRVGGDQAWAKLPIHSKQHSPKGRTPEGEALNELISTN
jgi:hypothetical protein